MNKTIIGMLEFINSGTADVAEIKAAIGEIGHVQFRLIAINVLSWFKSQQRIGKLWPLELNEQHAWCRDLLHLIKEKAFLTDLIHINDTTVLLLPDLAEKEIRDLLAFVDAGYQPCLMAGPRR
jgi:hypothetical protein